MDDQTINVLLIDEERLFSDLITKTLVDNYEVKIEKWQHLPQAHQIKNDAFDIILTDPFQGEGDFEDFLSEIKTLYPRIPVVFITRNKAPDVIVKSFRMGITDYLFKPFQEDEFKRMFQRAIIDLHSQQSPALEGIFQVCQQLNLCRSVYRFFYILALYIAKTLTSKRVVVLFKDPQTGQYEVLHTIGVSKTKNVTFQKLINQGHFEMFDSHEMFTFVHLEQLPLSFQKILGEKGTYLFFFLGHGKIGKGVLGFDLGVRPQEFVTPLLPKIEELLNESRIIFSNLMAFLKAREIALKDDITGLYNMRSFQPLVEAELEEAEKRGYPVSALFMDIDDFKKVNDSFGHLIGSKILKEVAKILRYNLRKGELIFRFGGDEFVVVLPATSLIQATQIGERIRTNIAHHVFQSREKEDIRITVSIGAAAYPDQTKNFSELLEVADKAMYHGKKGTKNVVYVAGNSEF